MNILIVTPDFPTDDQPTAGIFILRQAQALLKLDHNVRVLRIVPHAPPLLPQWRAYTLIPPRYTYDGIPVVSLRAFVPPRKIGLGLVRRQVEAAINVEIEKFKTDVVHAHFLLPPGLMVTKVDRPVVLTAHGSDAYGGIWQRKDLYRHAVAATQAATVVTAVSDFIRSKVERLGRKGVYVVFNGADEKVFFPADRSEARAALNIRADQPVLTFAGRILRSKGVFDLARAVKRLGEISPLIIIAGDGPEKPLLSKTLEQARIEARFLGNLPQVDLARVFAASDSVVLPSYGEGLPTVLCEAMLAGRAVIGTRVGGIPEIVKENETGLIVPVGDDEKLSRALMALLQDAALRERLERNAHRFALKSLTWSVNAQTYERVYMEASELFSASKGCWGQSQSTLPRSLGVS